MNQQLQGLHELCLKLANVAFPQRLQTLAESFLGCNYGAWVNGSDFESLDDFNYQLNLLDCVTYVEVVLALAKTTPHINYEIFKDNFETTLRKIHYANGVPNFLASNHFMCVDWIPNNKYLVEDITQSLSKEVKWANTEINRPNWTLKHPINNSKITILPEAIIQKIPAQVSSIPYIATEDILDNYKNYVAAFPDYCIINIVRPNWDLTERIGTHLNISHLGFSFKNISSQQLDFFHATVIKMLTIKQSLFDYLQSHLDSPTIRGISVLAISPGEHNARQ